MELAKPRRKTQHRSPNSSNFLVNESKNTNDLIDNSGMMKKRTNLNNISLNNESLVNKRNVNSSFHSNCPQNNQKIKLRNKSKKQQLQELLQQLQKLTPELKDLLKNQERKSSKSSSKNRKASSPKLLKPKKKKKENDQKKTKKKKVLQEKPETFSINQKIQEESKSFVREKKEKMFENKNSNDQSIIINKLIQKKNKKIALQTLFIKQKEQENDEKKLKKMIEMMKRNDEIRKTNKIRFLSIPKKRNSNENRSKEPLKPVYFQMKKTPPKPKKTNERERREELGLSWLNKLEENKYEEILERSRIHEKIEENNDRSSIFFS